MLYVPLNQLVNTAVHLAGVSSGSRTLMLLLLIVKQELPNCLFSLLAPRALILKKSKSLNSNP
jgi:hypothetical protein